MRAAEFSALRESLGLSLDWMARWMRYPTQLLVIFEALSIEISDDLCAPLLSIQEIMDQLAEQTADEYILQHSKEDRTVFLFDFESDNELWQLEPDMRPYPVSFYSALTDRMSDYLSRKNVVVTRSVLRVKQYIPWLKLMNLRDCHQSRVAWAKAVS